MSEELLVIKDENIRDHIFTIRGKQVMLDCDIARLFNVEPKRLNEQMKRNVGRFPEDFCFKLNSTEFKSLRSQNATFDVGYLNRKYLPYVYTEHGIIALAAVLKSEIAEKMSVEIVRTFIAMRKFIIENGDVLPALAKLQNRQIDFEIETNKRFDEIMKIISKVDLPKEALFYEGQYYDAYEYISSIVRRANVSILLIDPYCDSQALSYLKNRKEGVSIFICKSESSKLLESDIELFRKEFGKLEVFTRNDFHDRFLIIDKDECYSLGTSLNHMGKKIFAVTKIEDPRIIQSIVDMFR